MRSSGSGPTSEAIRIRHQREGIAPELPDIRISTLPAQRPDCLHSWRASARTQPLLSLAAVHGAALPPPARPPAGWQGSGGSATAD